MPDVTVPVNSPSGLPIATTDSPSCRADESPSFAAVRPVELTLTSAKSIVGSTAATVPLSWVPSESTTVTVCASPTTWWLVRIQPSERKMTPLPMSDCWPLWPNWSVTVWVASMVTTEGSAAATSCSRSWNRQWCRVGRWRRGRGRPRDGGYRSVSARGRRTRRHGLRVACDRVRTGTGTGTDHRAECRHEHHRPSAGWTGGLAGTHGDIRAGGHVPRRRSMTCLRGVDARIERGVGARGPGLGPPGAGWGSSRCSPRGACPAGGWKRQNEGCWGW